MRGEPKKRPRSVRSSLFGACLAAEAVDRRLDRSGEILQIVRGQCCGGSAYEIFRSLPSSDPSVLERKSNGTRDLSALLNQACQIFFEKAQLEVTP